MTLDVAISVDVEFSVGGAFADLARAPVGAASVECAVDGESAGLGFILDTLEAHGLRGVFFVEALQSAHFGDEPMAAIARRIAARGHDVQLHAHPCWLAFRDAGWRSRVRTAGAPCDSFARLADDAIGDALTAAVDAFRRFGLGAPLAFRAGNLEADLRIYPWLARLGIPLASNIGVGVFTPADRTLFLTGGLHRIGGCTEVPVASYPDFAVARRYKTFTVIGTGAWEARQWLASAARHGVGPLVVLTHPAEFVREERGRLRRNELARGRFASLCAHLARRRDAFDVVTFRDAAARWQAAAPTGNPRWSASPWARLVRLAENRSGMPRHAA